MGGGNNGGNLRTIVKELPSKPDLLPVWVVNQPRMKTQDLHLVVRKLLREVLEVQRARHFRQRVRRKGRHHGVVRAVDVAGRHVDNVLFFP